MPAGRDDLLTDALAAGLPNRLAADRSGDSLTTVKRRRKDAAFMAGVRERRARLLEDTAANLADANLADAGLADAGLAAVLTLRRAMLAEDAPAAARPSAARAVLAHALDYRGRRRPGGPHRRPGTPGRPARLTFPTTTSPHRRPAVTTADAPQSIYARQLAALCSGANLEDLSPAALSAARRCCPRSRGPRTTRGSPPRTTPPTGPRGPP